MTEPTAKSLALAATSVRLLIHPGTPEQRCFWTCKANRPDHQENAVRKARLRHPDAPLAWQQADGTLTPIL